MLFALGICAYFIGLWALFTYLDSLSEKKRIQGEKASLRRALEWQAEQNQKSLAARRRKAHQSLFSRRETMEKKAREAAKRAAHESRTLANKLRKKQARLEYSLRKYGVPYIEPK